MYKEVSARGNEKFGRNSKNKISSILFSFYNSVLFIDEIFMESFKIL